jgi:hypothetical protein
MPPPPRRTHHETRTTTPRTAVRVNYRFRPETVARIVQIAEERGGLTQTRVLELAVEELHKKIFGRRSANLVPPPAQGGGSPVTFWRPGS